MNLGVKIKGISGFLKVVAAAAMLAAPAAFAQTPERSPVLQEFEKAGGKVEFIGNAHGLDGWIVTDPKGGVQYAYTTKEGALIAAGMMFSPTGDLETKKMLEAYHQRTKGEQSAAPGAENSPAKSEKLYAEVEKAAWVAMGKSDAPYLYMFINVTCDHCQHFWGDIESAVKDGKIQVRMVPFGESAPNREGGAALLSADNPEEAWRDFIGGDKAALAADKIKDGAYDKIDKNTALRKEWKLKGPPFTIYRRPGDGALTAIVDRPRNVMLLMAEFLK